MHCVAYLIVVASHQKENKLWWYEGTNRLTSRMGRVNWNTYVCFSVDATITITTTRGTAIHVTTITASGVNTYKNDTT